MEKSSKGESNSIKNSSHISRLIFSLKDKVSKENWHTNTLSNFKKYWNNISGVGVPMLRCLKFLDFLT